MFLDDCEFLDLRRKPACFLRASIHASQLFEHRAPSLQSHLLVLRASLLVSRLKSFTFQKDRVKCSLVFALVYTPLKERQTCCSTIYIYIQYVNSPKKIDLKSASIVGTILRNENKLYIILFHWNFLVSFVETLHIFQAPIQIFNNKKKNPREILPLSFLFFSSRLICIQFAYRIGRGISNVKIVENRFHVYPISY